MVRIRFKQLISGWLRYGAGIINWKIDELNKMDRTRRKTLTMYGTLHPKSDIDRVYLKRKHGGRGLISIKMCVRWHEKKKGLGLKKKENNLGLYERGLSEMLLKGIKKVSIVKIENLVEKEGLKKISQNQFQDKLRENLWTVLEMPEEIDQFLSWNG